MWFEMARISRLFLKGFSKTKCHFVPYKCVKILVLSRITSRHKAKHVNSTILILLNVISFFTFENWCRYYTTVDHRLSETIWCVQIAAFSDNQFTKYLHKQVALQFRKRSPKLYFPSELKHDFCRYILHSF